MNTATVAPPPVFRTPIVQARLNGAQLNQEPQAVSSKLAPKNNRLIIGSLGVFRSRDDGSRSSYFNYGLITLADDCGVRAIFGGGGKRRKPVEID